MQGFPSLLTTKCFKPFNSGFRKDEPLLPISTESEGAEVKVLKKIDSIIEAVTTVICTILFAGIIGIAFVAVIFRYVINDPIMWSEEVIRFMAIWMILLGSSLTMRLDEHTSIDFVPTFFLKSGKAKAVHMAITRAICAVALIVFFPYSIELMEKMGSALGAATRLPMKYVYLAFPVGVVLTVIGTIKMIPEKCKELIEDKGEEDFE